MNSPQEYPTGICDECNQRVVATFVLKSVYEDTKQRLKSVLVENEISQENNSPIFDMTNNHCEDTVNVDSEEDVILHKTSNENDYNDEEEKEDKISDKSEYRFESDEFLTSEETVNEDSASIYSMKNINEETEKEAYDAEIKRQIKSDQVLRKRLHQNIRDKLYSISIKDINEETEKAAHDCEIERQIKRDHVLRKRPQQNTTDKLNIISIKDINEETEKASYVSEIDRQIRRNQVLRKRPHLYVTDKLNKGNHERINKEEESELDKTVTKNEKSTDKVNEGIPKLKLSTNRTSMKLLGIPLSQQSYLCPICRKQFRKIIQFIHHAKKHKILKRYVNKNLKTLQKSKFFAIPRQTDSIFNKEEILHKCTFCEVESCIENFQDHIADHFNLGDFTCSKCKRTFRKLQHLNIHMTLVHLEDSPYQCDVCGKGFNYRLSCEEHKLTHRQHNEELPHKCEYCGKGFTNKHRFQRHAYKHTHGQSFWVVHKTIKCKVCIRSFETVKDLEEHNKSPCQPFSKQPPKDLRVWSCELCKKSYKTHSSLITHKYSRCLNHLTHNSKNVKVVKYCLCDICGDNVANIKQHMKSHGPKEEPVECHICNRKLSSKSVLTRHIRVHTGERPHACKYCNKRFKDSYTKAVHERIHEGVKKHVCTICGKGFLEKSYLLKHQRGVHKYFNFTEKTNVEESSGVYLEEDCIRA